MGYLFYLFIFLSGQAYSHPVIYKGGTMIGSSNMFFYSDNQINYSFDTKWATGLNHWRMTKNNKTTEFGLARLNHLLWRKNSEDSQTNIYLVSGLGIVDSEIDKRRTNIAYLGGFETDWETRSFCGRWVPAQEEIGC